jgi:hypothetical protein
LDVDHWSSLLQSTLDPTVYSPLQQKQGQRAAAKYCVVKGPYIKFFA